MREKGTLTFPLPDQKNIFYLPADYFTQYKPYFDLFNQSQRIIAHSLFEPALSVFANYPGTKKIYFVPWGSDIAPFIFRNFYDRMDTPTRSLFRGDGPAMAQTTYEQMSAEWDLWRKMNSAIGKMNRTLHVVPFEQVVLNVVFKRNLPQHIPFQYYNPVDFKQLEVDELPANSDYHFKKRFSRVIQVNHSGNPANNHISLIDKLATLKRDDFCVVAPLSYGSPQAIEAVVKYGHEKLGERFFPIKEFLPPDQYAAFLRQVDVLLLNTFYSGGTANMNSMLYLGRKVMLNSQNLSTHATFKLFGLTLPPIGPPSGDSSWLDELFTDLDEETRQKNRESISRALGEEKLVEIYDRLLKATAEG
jgi:hypothetical protein